MGFRPLGGAAALLLGGALLTACGSGKPAATGGGTATPAGCNSGAAAAAGSFALNVAQEPDSGVAKISGKCWAGIKYTGAPNTSTGTVPAGDSAEFKVAWNPTNLYVLAYVQMWPLIAGSSTIWKNDTVEFYVAGDNTHSSSYDAVDCHYDVTFNGATSARKCPTGPINGLAQVVQNKGYYAELIVPWSTLSVAGPAKGQQYAMTIQWDVGDSGGNRTGQGQWAGGANDDAGKTTNWGALTLA